MKTRRIIGLITAIFVAGISALQVSAQENRLFYSKDETTAEYASYMAGWNGVKGAFSEKTSDGVRIGVGKNAGAYFAFPTYLIPERSDCRGYKYVQVHVKNESAFGMYLGVVITDNETYNDTGHEHFQLKNNSVAYIQDDKTGKIMKRTSFYDGVYIPGSFNGNVFIPLDAAQMKTLSWASVDGELNLQKITNISYYINSIDSSVIIGDVYMTNDDPSPKAEEISFTTPTTSTTSRNQLTTTTSPAEESSTTPTAEGPATEPSDAVVDTPSSNPMTFVWIFGGSLVIVAGCTTGIVLVLRKKRGKIS